MIKNFLKKIVKPYNYPQFIFARSISRELKFADAQDETVIIDVPCGNGQTSFLLAKRNEKTRVFGYDISSSDIDYAHSNFMCSNLFFDVADIKDVFTKHVEIDIVCIINSIFLLPNNKSIFEQIDKSLNKKNGKLCFVIPNIEGQNYKNFMRLYDGSINTNEYSPKTLEVALEPYNFVHQSTKPLAYAYIYGRKELKYLHFLAPFYLLFLNFFQSHLSIGKPSYYLVTFGRKRM